MARLYVVGIGPGDPELLTLKAKRVLERVKTLFFPKGREEGESLARSIVGSVLDLRGKHVEELHFPMARKGEKGLETEVKGKWGDASRRIVERLKGGKDVAFLTLGDPGLYSTFFYLVPYLEEALPNIEIEVIPGVSSVSLAFSKLKLPIVLGDEAFVVLPATYFRDIEKILQDFPTVVLMKVHRVFKECLDIIKGHEDLDAYYVARLGMGDEIIKKEIEKVTEEDLNYFSMIVIKRRRDE